ncbi:MAG: hypothetical protein MK066_08960 [Crocinitomicaceae bacterium]|nr:hypothetical protein [Crocinitomicaceae bacterium]
MKNRILVLFLLVICLNSFGQLFTNPRAITSTLEEQREHLIANHGFLIGYNAGITFAFGQHNTSEIRFNFSIGASKGFGSTFPNSAPFLGTYQIQLEAFKGGVGSSLLGGERAHFIWELRNILQLNIGHVANNTVKGRPLTKLVGSSEYAIKDPFDYSFGIGTVFVNGLNHKRNQQLGYFTGGVLEIGFGYLNDGPPFGWMGLGDTYDRWWTGAGYLGAYFQNNNGFITDIALQYQRYTGWQPNLYEMTNMLGLDYLSYKDKTEQFLNQGSWTWTSGILNSIRIDVKIYEAKKFDIQNLIHIGRNFTFHPNALKKRVTFGGGFLLNGMQTFNF